MPSKTPKQRRFMAAAANNPDFAKRAGIPVSVAKEYHEADKKAKGGKAERKYEKKAKITEHEYGPFRTEHKGFSAISPRRLGLGRRSRKHKGYMAVQEQPKSRMERRARRRALAKQERGGFGDEVRTKVKDPGERRNLVRAGWVPYTPPSKRRGKQGGKRRQYGLNKHTVFYPPSPATQFTGQPTGGLARTIQYRDPRSYIAGGAEGGKVEEAQKFFYGGPAGRRKKMLEEKRKREADPNWQPWMELGTQPLTWKQLVAAAGGGRMGAVKAVQRAKALGWVPDKQGEGVDLKTTTWYPPEQTMAGRPDATGTTTYTGYDPYYGRGPARNGEGFTEGGIDPTVGQGGGRGRRGGRRGRGSRTPPRGRPPADTPPPREIPPTITPPVVQRDRRAGRDTPYSQALAEHRERIRQSLAVPAGGFAEGGAVRGYQEGGTARSDNPFDPVKQKYQWRAWERKHGRDPDEAVAPPPPPPPPEEEAEDEGLFSRLFGRSERELEEQEQAMGGRVNYQRGGMAALREAALAPPMGGVPPRVQMREGGEVNAFLGGGMAELMRRAMQQRGQQPRSGFAGLRAGNVGRRRGPPPQMTGGMASMIRRLMAQRSDPRTTGEIYRSGDREAYLRRRGIPAGSDGRPSIRRGQMPPVMTPPRPGMPPRARMPIKLGRVPGGPVQPPADGMITGGPQIPPSLRGRLQAERMMNRPPRMVGRGVNRVGQGDQQGALARALQRGTGRPPMSRRGAFVR